MSGVDLAKDLQTRTVHSFKCTEKNSDKENLELNMSDEGHVQDLATADSSSVAFRDKREFQAGWVQNMRQDVSLSLSAGRVFKVEIFEQPL